MQLALGHREFQARSGASRQSLKCRTCDAEARRGTGGWTAPLHCARRPPAPLREPAMVAVELFELHQHTTQSRGRVDGCAPPAAPRSAGDRGLRIAARRGVERSLSEHRAQACAASACRPCEGEFCARPRAPSIGGESARRADRRCEAQPATRPRLCALDRNEEHRVALPPTRSRHCALDLDDEQRKAQPPHRLMALRARSHPTTSRENWTRGA